MLPPLAIDHISVKAPQLGPDADSLPQDAREHSPLDRAVEASDASAGVRTAAGLPAAGHEDAVASREAEQFPLRRAAAAACAAPQRRACYEPSCAGGSWASIGMPSVPSSSAARCGCGTTVSRSTSPSAVATATASGP